MCMLGSYFESDETGLEAFGYYDSDYYKVRCKDAT